MTSEEAMEMAGRLKDMTVFEIAMELVEFEGVSYRKGVEALGERLKQANATKAEVIPIKE